MRLAPLFLLLALPACSLFGTSSKYLVFFQERSAELDGGAGDVIAEVAARAGSSQGSRIQVIGYTDNAGSPAADVLLSKLRAQVVTDALIADGVVASRIVPVAQGQANGNPGVASRRVEIMLVP